ncbi:MAG: bifunctional 3,4-dihydroxy-2-butanone-4-phosphate synthase/GTP cyclohydrolase II [Candidatus Mcinerneyibacterium aminivorans]|uniref:Riboflavin biosynthesis protein RibBA n=1 Tax=Candidatus Mcinerneyibacterium aminivorans TaxID=2703815 RepID=A0A5D0MG03_9BACT|nr:MAG: bifunctional 3,4-dihydroxy-2-butanone-4-phosphate synthase/GTP cyclohydrolase II [Candidatus Mcinerneyibacterium aminivorans]
MERDISSIEKAINEFQRGNMIIVVDDEDRENEGDLIIPAEKVTPEDINFMTKYGRGLVCLSLTEKRINKLGLKMMTEDNESMHDTAFTQSIEAKHGVTTGISAYDRSHTIKTAIKDNVSKDEIVVPGHIFPLKAKPGGVLERAGHTEAAVDLTKLAGLKPSGVICEIMDEDGTMMRLPKLKKYAAEHDLIIITIADLIQYRLKRDKFMKRKAKADLPTEYGQFKIYGYENEINKKEHVALVKGNVNTDEPVLVRVHSECLTGDAFGSQKCDCGNQLHIAMEMIEKENRGVLIYLRQEGRGIGLLNKIKAYHLQDKGMDTVEANVALGFPPDLRNYGIGAQILSDLGVKKIKLLTNNPKKLVGLSGYGMEILERIPLQGKVCKHNIDYIKTKKEKMGHMIEDVD